MEYHSPLGYNFKLEESLSASKTEKSKETPKKDDFISLDNFSSRKFFDSDNKRNSGGTRNNYSPAWQRQNKNWKSPDPRNSQHNEATPIEQYYHPSMLENPWEELEKNLNVS